MSDAAQEAKPTPSPSWIDRVIRFCLTNKVIVGLMLIAFVAWGLYAAPFDWNLWGMPRDPVPVDAIPDIGEHQQIVFTEWPGRSPQDVEDQITYPLTVSLLGIPGVRTVRSFSMFGFSTVYLIFEEGVEFYWSRSRVLEKLNSLPSGMLPADVQPTLGPDATALGQVFWYTLEGRDPNGKPTGGWDLQELRTIQDWYVRYGLLAAEGVSEVASVGGFVQEYQVDVDPDAMRAAGVTLTEVIGAVKMSNLDVGARTIEVNKVEYVIRGLGFVKTLADLENAVIKVKDNVPIYVKNVAHVTLGPALRRGALDKEGTEAVGGVVVVRYGENPLAAIKNVKKKIEDISPGLPSKVLPDGTVSKVTIVPFYDRTGLIHETLGTLETAITQQILVTIIVVLIMVVHLRSSVLISGLLPLAVLMTCIAMKVFGVDANIVALSGIAIAIGTMVDMGIVICENILRHLEQADESEPRLEVVYRASSEVGGAVLTAVATTVVGFLPVFAMTGPEGKLFRPLAFTKTFALVASVIIALTIIPPAAHWLFTGRIRGRVLRISAYGLLLVAGIAAGVWLTWWIGLLIVLIAVYRLADRWVPEVVKRAMVWGSTAIAVVVVAVLLSQDWLPLGPEKGQVRNLVFVALLIGGVLLGFVLFQRWYRHILGWCLNHKVAFLSIPSAFVLLGLLIWLGFETFFGWLPYSVKQLRPVTAIAHELPGLGKEFMPPLDEGSYLLMPTTMVHASIGEVMDILRKQDMAIRQIPEVESVVGKLGRVESALDPAPISMIETIINYKSQYVCEASGRRLTFRHDPAGTDLVRDENGTPLLAPDGEPYTTSGKFARDEANRLIPDPDGAPFRLWRPALEPELNPGREAWAGIQEPDDIWNEIIDAADVPGTTSAPRLQPIAARIVMLQSGMRAPMGVKVKGPDLETIEKVGIEIERYLREIPSVEAAAVNADRIVGKPYLEIHIDRKAIARYGIMLQRVQEVIEVAIGGRRIGMTVEGRQRYPIRVRYLRELRDSIEALGKILVAGADGTQIPLSQLATITYVRGPQAIKSEDTFMVGYVTFDMRPGYAEVDVVEQAQAYLRQKIASGELKLPAGVSYEFSGNYENQIHAQKKLMIVLPLSLFIIFLLLYLQFKSVPTSMLVFSGIIVAWAGGFVMIWLYAQPWFLDFGLFGVNMRSLFSVHTINLSVAIWVGFLALFGIASDDGVVMATYLKSVFAARRTLTVHEIRGATIEAGLRRVRPCLMTTATTVLALIPVLTSTGRGSDIMVPMAIPCFGGMVLEVITMLVVPTLYCAGQELRRAVTK
ncbi:MAG: efflux RND transporter permease subunit [Phycisphaerae bacterium]|nr:efflux RND transporter permease subunit [Phycisphaerae bacterium]